MRCRFVCWILSLRRRQILCSLELHTPPLSPPSCLTPQPTSSFTFTFMLTPFLSSFLLSCFRFPVLPPPPTFCNYLSMFPPDPTHPPIEPDKCVCVQVHMFIHLYPFPTPKYIHTYSGIDTYIQYNIQYKCLPPSHVPIPPPAHARTHACMHALQYNSTS